MAVFTHDPAALVLYHAFGCLRSCQVAATLYRVGLSIMKRVGALRAVRLHGPATIRARLNGYLRFTCHGSSPPARFDVSGGVTGMSSLPGSLDSDFASALQSNSINTPS